MITASGVWDANGRHDSALAVESCAADRASFFGAAEGNNTAVVRSIMSKRVVTSAIPDMTVAEVRRGLDFVRTKWREQQEGVNNFHLSEQLFNGMTVQEFCFKFTLGHHYKRHAKSKRGGGESCEESSTTAELDNPEKEPSPSTGKRKR